MRLVSFPALAAGKLLSDTEERPVTIATALTEIQRTIDCKGLFMRGIPNPSATRREHRSRYR